MPRDMLRDKVAMVVDWNLIRKDKGRKSKGSAAPSTDASRSGFCISQNTYSPLLLPTTPLQPLRP